MPNAIRYNPDASKLDPGMMRQAIQGIGANPGFNAKKESPTVTDVKKFTGAELARFLSAIPQS
ncbi:MAG: hypothetical protein KBD00_01155 [Candidatus Peribacteraceae bacterium]|nr:hypothetical protein [Candidatus Peribacteraceae bacterium]